MFVVSGGKELKQWKRSGTDYIAKNL